MNAEMQNIYTEYIAINDEIKRLSKKLEEHKASIIKFHDKNKLICEDGYQSELTPAVRKSPVVSNIESKFGISLTDDCYKTTHYERLSVKKIVNG